MRKRQQEQALVDTKRQRKDPKVSERAKGFLFLSGHDQSARCLAHQVQLDTRGHSFSYLQEAKIATRWL
jgi:hypothetical protein